MTWTHSTSLDEFRAAADAFLAARPAQNTVLLTVVHRLAEAGPHAFGDLPPQFGWWRAAPGGPVTGAYLRTPPYGARLGEMPAEAAAALAVELAEVDPEMTVVGGGQTATEAFGAAWRHATGTGSTVRTSERLYRLGELTEPARRPEGRHREAGAGDRELLIDWYEAFAVETGVLLTNIPSSVDGRIAAGTLHLWEDGGRVVAMAGHSPVIAGMSRIGPVYTPAELRGNGYASVLTAATTARALDLGAAEVLLYTDLSNPTSNSIYQKIGYRPVEDCVELEFAPAAG